MKLNFAQVNGSALFYLVDTPPGVVKFIERHLRHSQRFVFVYGDVKTGEPWEPYPHWGSSQQGYIGNSTGPIKIPLAIYNSRSLGGGAILASCVVRILSAVGKFVLYDRKEELDALVFE